MADMTARYNEWDKGAAAWLRELIRHGHLPEGEVDERSISDLAPADAGPISHFFAGIGGWPYALRLAGWPDDRPVWTASLPCQPFSAAGKGLGYDDERHLAPVFLDLVRQCRPPVIFGEQVASAAGRAWFSDLRVSLEGMGYALGCADLCAAGIGAPHIRQRLFWGAVRAGDALPAGWAEGWPVAGRGSASGAGATGGLADADDAGPQGRGGMPECADECAIGARGMDGRMADAKRGTAERHGSELGEAQSRVQGEAREQRFRHDSRDGDTTGGRPGALHGGWSDADWLFCRDGRWRPVEPGTFPLADGLPARVGRLRGFGNAIVPALAAEFVLSFMDAWKDLAA